MSKHTVPRIAYRYVAGRPLDGAGRTNSGYLRRGSGKASRWARLPGWRRQVVRVGVPAGLYAAHAVYVAEPTYAAASLALLAGVAGQRGLRAGRRAWRTRRFRAVYIRPVLASLAPALGDAPVKLHVDPSMGSLMLRLAKPMSPAEKAAREWYGQHIEPVVRWLPDRTMRGLWSVQRAATPLTSKLEVFRRPVEAAGARIELVASVPYLTAEQRQFVSAVIGQKIPAGADVEQWDQVGDKVRATWTVRKRPPAGVGYADLAARLDNLKEWEFFIGLGIGGKPVIISLKDDSPHIALSAGTGAGKSVLAQLVAVQVLARGGRVVILDRKGSHRWALGMPGVDYCTTPEQMHNALARLAKLADDRNTAALHEDEDWDPGYRTLLIAEELNATMAQIRAWWDDVREKGQPKIPPAVRAFRELMFMGRSAKVNVLAVAQMLTALTTGGPESRENFGVRCLSRYSRNNWQMLVPEAAMPRASRTLGRWQIVTGGVATETQVCYLSAAEARLLVHKRTGVATVADSPLIAPTSDLSQRLRQDTDPMAVLMSLREAADRGAVPWPYTNARQRLLRARKAGRTVPEPARRDGTTDLYRVGDLIAWIESELIQ